VIAFSGPVGIVPGTIPNSRTLGRASCPKHAPADIASHSRRLMFIGPV
jgi:hypothetical protein